MARERTPYRAYRSVLWRLVSYLTAATVAGIAVASAPRANDSDGAVTPSTAAIHS
jgi:hypothetical protein